MKKPANNMELTPGQPPTPLLQAVQQVLRPLVRGFIRFGLTYPALSNMLKRIYVQSVQDEFRIAANKPASDSRITLLTGVHRKDVRKFREEQEPTPLALSNVSLTAQIIAQWLGDPQYCHEDNKPKPIPRFGAEPGSFEALIRSISKDMHPRAILDELLQSGAVHLDDAEQVHLNTKAYVPEADFENLAFYYGLNLHDHIAASTHNLSGNAKPFLDRCVHYSGLSPQSVTELEQLSRELGMQSLLSLNARAQELEIRDRDSGNTNQRMTFGIYFYNTEDNSEGGDDE